MLKFSEFFEFSRKLKFWKNSNGSSGSNGFGPSPIEPFSPGSDMVVKIIDFNTANRYEPPDLVLYDAEGTHLYAIFVREMVSETFLALRD